ncbi:hypothetical protein HY345_01615 [Candidatus Microgenomates bacterium]|nr:hypothetical protein [Candidatus Microgenomates bacterium]
MLIESHTPIASIQEMQSIYLERLEKIFSLYQRAGVDARLIGSLGAGVSLNQPLTSFYDEFQRLRDIDIVLLNETSSAEQPTIKQKASLLAWPLTLEEHFRHQIFLQGPVAAIRYKEIAFRVDPVVFSLRSYRLGNIIIPSFDPNTLFHITALYGFMRPKDLKNMLRLRRAIKNRADVLPETLFEPFHRLNIERTKRYKADQVMGHLRWCYHHSFPIPVRKTLSAITVPVWKKIKGDGSEHPPDWKNL